jgi:hypothetical protein
LKTFLVTAKRLLTRPAVTASDHRKGQTPHTVDVKTLAGQVADAIEGGMIIGRTNPYYGGMGLRFAENTYIYGPICDGDVLWPSYRRMSRDSSPQLEFSRREDFLAWLIGHLTQQASGATQDVNVARLQHAVHAFRGWDGQGTLYG